MRSQRRSLVILVFALAFVSAQAQQEPSKTAFRFPVPEKALLFLVDLPGYQIEINEMRGERRRYVFAKNETTHVVFSVFLESLPPEQRGASCRQHLQRRAAGDLKEQKPKVSEWGQMVLLESTVEFAAEKLPGSKFPRRNLFACLQKDDAFADIHLSKVYFKPEEEQLFYAILQTARFEEGAGIYEAGMRAYDQGDYSTASKHLAPLAEQGVADAQFSLAVMYANGHGVPQSYPEAMKWYRKAAAQGHELSTYRVGGMYERAEGVSKDLAEAAKWYRRAAEQGLSFAQERLGAMYRTGEDVPKDYSEAAKWFRKAAEQGVPEAQANLAGMYALGQGVAQDYVEAIKWYRMAAEQGNARAQYRMGGAHVLGQGVKPDWVVAYMWFSLALMNADAEPEFREKLIKLAKEDLDQLAKMLKREQIAEAERLAHEWRPKKWGPERLREDASQQQAEPPAPSPEESPDDRPVLRRRPDTQKPRRLPQ